MTVRLYTSCTGLVIASLVASGDCFLPPSLLSRGTATCDESVIFSTSKDAAGAPSLRTALCIIPPDESWDTIQRARHMSNDPSYSNWPPAVRLFYPFCPPIQLEDQALEVARLVEKHHVKPFNVVLTSISVIPHLEAIAADMAALRTLPAEQEYHETIDEPDQAQRDFEELVEREAELGRKRLQNRAKGPSYGVKKKARKRKVGVKDLIVSQQQQMFNEFNGPCVVVLEPDEPSCKRLKKLREMLRKERFDEYSKFSPSSSLPTKGKGALAGQGGDEFRPVVPIGGFSSVMAAVEFAKTVKDIWRPLTFRVEDLQLISDVTEIAVSDDEETKNKISTTATAADENFDKASQFGCDAAVMLLGEEIEQDDDVNEIMVDFLTREGIPGAADTTGAANDVEDRLSALISETASPSVAASKEEEELLNWLDEDDSDYDSGTAIVIGRTHFFTGELREFESMPAERGYRTK